MGQRVSAQTIHCPPQPRDSPLEPLAGGFGAQTQRSPGLCLRAALDQDGKHQRRVIAEDPLKTIRKPPGIERGFGTDPGLIWQRLTWHRHPPIRFGGIDGQGAGATNGLTREAAAQIAFDIAQERGGHPGHRSQVQPASGIDEVRDKVGIALRATPPAPQPRPGRIETRPERQDQQDLRRIRRTVSILHGFDKGVQGRIARLRRSSGAMLMAQKVRGVRERRERRIPRSERLQLEMKPAPQRRGKEPCVKTGPGKGHGMPALRPGVRRLLVARSGRHASLRFQGVG